MNTSGSTKEVTPLPCPFCGGTNVSPTEGSTFRWMAAQCAECGATCGEVRVQTMGNGTPETWDAKAKVNAIMEWNKRFAPEPGDDTRAVLEDIEKEFDEQIHWQLKVYDFDAPADAQYDVKITAGLWRRIGQALARNTPTKGENDV